MREPVAPVKKKKKVDPTTRSDYQQQVPNAAQAKPKPASKPRGQATFRGGSKGSKTLDDFKKAKAARDAKKTGPKKATNTHTDKFNKKKSKVKPLKPKKKKNPKKPKKDSVKTTPTVKAVTYGAIDLNSQYDEQKAAILNAYLSLAGTELFQYVNSQSIDGAYNDVAIINVLSRRRQEYTPNRLIELAEVFIKYMWVEDGNLCIEIDDDADLWDVCVLSFTVGSDVIVAKTIN